jgi:uncharacterized membrane protein YkvA (DUF1232 family)
MDACPEAWSEESFWSKLGRFSRKAGREVVERALVLYYCLRDTDTPGWARGVIVGALGYFVLPMDAIPDLIPFSGFADDFSVLVAALVSVAHHVKPEHRFLARQRLVRWFGGAAGPDRA